jgi:hypothetical protein
MASIKVTFSGETSGTTYDVVIETASGSNKVGEGSVPAEGGYVNYDDSHGDNYAASTNRRSATFSKSFSSVNISL